MLAELLNWLESTQAEGHPAARPRVTLSYAQSLDGSLTARRGQPLALSGPQSRAMTHELRARHDAILVGIGTVLADDPLLNVRYATGADPRPVVLDTRLRLPLCCRLLDRNENLPWVAAGAPVDPVRRAALEEKGARVLEIGLDAGGRVALVALLSCLHRLGVRSLMVEGGASVISTFLRLRLVDQAVITIAPVFMGGLNLIQQTPLLNQGSAPALVNPVVGQFGRDTVIWGLVGNQEL